MKPYRHVHRKRENPWQEGITVCRGRLWLERDGATFLGTGRVVLLERIREHGSISRAARSMKMSYKHAWDLVDSMNRKSPDPLVITSKGGKGGGGARLTAAGEREVAAFWELQERFSAFLQAETK
ncbi:winged helix-turn-helix domain-containing protein [Desulfomarina profundi]|uniref:winged helix-turn-helix domain-containing protein n=1 Tax=Desulfomarina profundi TaxID=2772557 RepID=UPI001E5697C0|nr:LysR family transcriptional regulator [Desulfomarina profundi]